MNEGDYSKAGHLPEREVFRYMLTFVKEMSKPFTRVKGGINHVKKSEMDKSVREVLRKFIGVKKYQKLWIRQGNLPLTNQCKEIRQKLVNALTVIIFLHRLKKPP